MPSLVAKKKGNKLYYYVVESARVEGKPRIVHQAYLGTAEKLAEMVRDRTAPIPLAASMREFGLPTALWAAAQQTGVWDLLHALWPSPRSGPSPAYYVVLAAIHRICQPGPKTEWYRSSMLSALWDFSPERFTSQAFWDAFEQILPEAEQDLPVEQDPLEQAQLRLLALWKEKQLVSRRLLAYDTTNFYTYIASNNPRNQLAQRGHNKQGRHNLRQVGLSYVLDGENGLSLCHHVYPGNVADVEEFSTALARPPELRSRTVEELPVCSSAQPGVRAASEKILVHGREYVCVVKYSASFAGEQLHSVTTSLSRVLQALRRLARDMKKPKARWKREQIVRKIERWLSVPFLHELIRYQLEEQTDGWHLQFDFDSIALPQLLNRRLGRTVLLTNHMDWSAEQVVAGYAGQQAIERVFRGLKDGDWLNWDPMHHWTDRKIRIHAFYCMLGISLLHHVHKQAQTAWADLSIEQLLEELEQIKQFVLLYPPQGEKGPARTAYVLSQQTLAQQALVKALGLEQLHRSTPRG